MLDLAAQINKDYHGKTIDLLVILKGAFIFAGDLIRQLSVDVRVHFLEVRSYDGGTETSGTVYLQYSSEYEVNQKDVLLVEDILDTGITLEFLMEHLKAKQPNTIKVCVLLDKPSRRKIAIEADYVGFQIEDRFVIGYGLDYNEQGRSLPHVAVLL